MGSSQVNSACPLPRAAAVARATSSVPSAINNRRRRSSTDDAVNGGAVCTWPTQPSDEVADVEAAAAEVVSMSGGTEAGHRVLHPAGDPGRPDARLKQLRHVQGKFLGAT
jgi:hypothetical protein